jgi:type IV fimbrial biogenesis protein FimT
VNHPLHQPNRRSAGRCARGLTLIESAVTLAVVAIVAGMALPSFEQARERRHLEGVAAQLETDIQWARSLAVARNEVVRMTFVAGDEAVCYMLHTGGTSECQCTDDGGAACPSGSEVLRSVRLGSEVPVTLQSNARSLGFDPVKGTVTPTAPVRVRGSGGAAIHQVVNVMGRVRSCSPDGVVAGYRPC